ncbi:MAG TPA: carboxypeptidase-like regulatory domain-containing protein, partial [Arachidicoccus sp.]|nr:carboxypeptidase-like regulatory domain-containing protein [Arachidicoccus sp.]
MKKKNSLLQGLLIIAVALLFLIPKVSSAQGSHTLNITGTVVDEAGQALPGATVKVKGKAQYKIAGDDGSFEMTVPDSSVLVVSNVGFREQEVPVSGSTIRVVLQSLTAEADAVVVIGYGTVKKSDLTGAVAKMDAKDLENRPLARPETALQGKLAGVTVRTTTGEPGADMQIRVRGAASVNASSDPLYV